MALEFLGTTPSRAATHAPGIGLTVAASVVAFLVAELADALSPLVVAVGLGAMAGNVGAIAPAAQVGLAFVARRVLRAGIVLLGLRLSIGVVADLGVATLIVVASTVVATFFATQWLGRRLGLSRDLSLLVATGYSICGASAIAAVEGSTEADEEEVAAAIGLVTLFGSLAIVVLPLLADPLGLDDEAFGMWVGASVHDVAQVAATASSAGSVALATAVVVKLTRVVLLAPIVFGVNVQRRRVGSTDRPPVVPAFVAGFLAMVVVRSTGVLPDAALDLARVGEKLALTAALFALGAGVRIDRLRRLGLTPLVLGAAAWIVVAGVALAGVVLV